MTDADYTAALVAATGRLAAMTGDDLDTPVATCPGWTVQRLMVHVGRIHRWVAIALQSPDGRDVPAVARPPADTDVSAWLLEGVNHLVDAFADAGPDGQVTSPGWEHPARWWLRRTTHETTLHAWDAQAATGAPIAIATALALDGLDEVTEVFIPNGLDVVAFGGPATIHLHCTDADGEWLITVPAAGSGTPVTVEPRHAKGDVAVRGGASDLLLWTWNRLGHHRLDVVGDASVADRYANATHF